MVREKSRSVCGDGLCHDHVFIGSGHGEVVSIFGSATITDGKLSRDKSLNSLGEMLLSVVARFNVQGHYGGAIFTGLFLCGPSLLALFKISENEVRRALIAKNFISATLLLIVISSFQIMYFVNLSYDSVQGEELHLHLHNYHGWQGIRGQGHELPCCDVPICGCKLEDSMHRSILTWWSHLCWFVCVHPVSFVLRCARRYPKMRNQMNIYTTLGVQSSSLFITYDLVASNTVFRTMLGEQMVHETMTSCSCH
ncbi:uncharacterized protein LOC104583750 isoform X3 [Brachypodium distachyon]|uniref:uncharacterized protein LOC104583750 isoform X3 n=1 Tax=Brachypodium distachyon TaxID=15368 RepID=UPI000D0D7E3F|nr:uncharacterized protein LOC104583750 isoform X3 [Brachypodium distachyon]|eukprot:XP_024317663.1 uncharacterized protein LOC104583750 isoform X3 [Brachypodium distachyon]